MALHPRSLGFRFSARIEDLRVSDALELSCKACGHKYLLAPYQLLERFTPNKHLNELEKNFRCKKCGASSCGRWNVMQAMPLLHDVSKFDTE